MPLPQPRDNENQNEFISRCMSDDTMREDFGDTEQRLTVCFEQWRRENRGKAMKTEHKTFNAEIKQVSKAGEFEAVIATLNVVDHDGDIIRPGAFPSDKVSIQPSHDGGAIPIGQARIREEGDKAIASGKLNLETQAGREWHSHLKFDFDDPPAIQEWSFGFMIDEASSETHEGQDVRVLEKMDVFEISPVLLGAGIETETLAVKTRKQFSDRIDAAIAEVSDIVEHARHIRTLREQKGSKLSPEREAQLAVLTENIAELKAIADALSQDDWRAPADENGDEYAVTPEDQIIAEEIAREAARLGVVVDESG